MVPVSTLIEIDPQGVAWLTGTNSKVIEVVLDKLAYGWSPEEIHFQHPGISLAQIHAALSYYYENKAQMDAEIARQRQDVERLAAAQRESPLHKKLLALKNR
jgi:uncharacterized protein (DUF433 family)